MYEEENRDSLSCLIDLRVRLASTRSVRFTVFLLGLECCTLRVWCKHTQVPGTAASVGDASFGRRVLGHCVEL